MKNDLQTPRWIDSIIDNLAPQDLAEEIRGDLYEMFLTDAEEKGMSSAKRRYVFNALGFLAKSFFWKKSHDTNNAFIMFLNYFKMAGRSLSAYKGTAIINILGLVIGIASALVIFTVIRFELSFDKFHSDADSIYRMVRVSGSDMAEFRTGISYPVPDALKNEVPSLQHITSMEYFGGAYVDVLNSSGKSVAMFREDRGCVLVEPSFFKIFDFQDADLKWIEGNPAKALEEPFNIVLTESMAKKYFPDGKALGKSIRFEKYFDSKVTGVISDFPSNTDFPFTILISYSTLKKLRGNLDDWFSVNDPHHTYIKLPAGTTKTEMEALIAKVHAAHTPKDLHESRHYLLQELSEIHHDARFGTYSGRTISHNTILSLTLIAVFLLLTASINYINLATAQSTMRSKEIGLRKVMGSHRENLIAQFLIETFVIVLIAGLLGLILSRVLLINLQHLVNMNVTSYNFGDPFMLVTLLIIVIVLTLFSGFYPSIVISRFNPVNALKNKFGTEAVGNISLRKILVVAQFTITQMLVVGTFIVVSQMNYFQNVDMGFNRDAKITLNLPNTSPFENLKIIEDKLRARAIVADVSLSSTLPSGVRRNRSYMGIGRPEAQSQQDFQVFEYQSVDPSYVGVYEIKLLAGRNLNFQDSALKNVLINRALVKTLQLGTPEEAIGKQLKMGGGNMVSVVGVVENFYSNSLKEAVDNLVIEYRPRSFDFVTVKLDRAASIREAVSEIEKVWRELYPEHIFNYDFLEDNIKAFYAQEQKYAQLFQIFSVIFLLIGCLGLYGLITFVVNRKSKEVAIRKVLGATLSNILVMFSREYLQLIILSFALAVPVAYYAVNTWLSNFANHIELKWWYFATPGLIVLIIALLVVTTKSLRAAHANPIDKLKYE